jgi:hypothetical protein
LEERDDAPEELAAVVDELKEAERELADVKAELQDALIGGPDA